MSLVRVYDWVHAPPELRAPLQERNQWVAVHPEGVNLEVDWVNMETVPHPNQDDYAGFAVTGGSSPVTRQGRRKRRKLPPKEQRGWTPYVELTPSD